MNDGRPFLNVYVAKAQPSATYQTMDRVASRRTHAHTQVAGMRALREAVAEKFRTGNGLDVAWQGHHRLQWRQVGTGKRPSTGFETQL